MGKIFGAFMEWDWSKLLSLEHLSGEENRTRAQRDFDSIMFTSCFPRLGGKTQVVPLRDDEATHSRLTHSLEVMSIARSFGFLLQRKLMENGLQGEWSRLRKSIEDWNTDSLDLTAQIAQIDLPFILSAAALLHDAGNPPFGHFGEEAIGSWFRYRYEDLKNHPRVDSSKGELLTELMGFDGNAQALRVALHGTSYRGLERGLMLAPVTIGTFVKYPRGYFGGKNKKFGYFPEEREEFLEVWQSLGLREGSRHPFSLLSEMADDIVNPLIDLEDSVESHLVTLEEAYQALEGIVPLESSVGLPSDFPKSHKIQAMTRSAIRPLIREVFNEFDQFMSKKRESGELAEIKTCEKLEPIRQLLRERVYRSREVELLEIARFDAIHGILDCYWMALSSAHHRSYGKKLFNLMPSTLRDQVESASAIHTKLRIVIDFVAAMTDQYAVRFRNEILGIKLP